MIQDNIHNISIKLKPNKVTSVGNKKRNQALDDSMYEIQMKKIKSFNIKDEIAEELKENNSSISNNSNFDESMI